MAPITVSAGPNPAAMTCLAVRARPRAPFFIISQRHFIIALYGSKRFPATRRAPQTDL